MTSEEDSEASNRNPLSPKQIDKLAAQAIRYGMTLDQFWESNPWEIRIMAQGYSERIRDTQEVHAGLTASLMNVTQQLKRPKKFTVAKLIGNRPGGNKLDRSVFNSREEWLAAIKELKKSAADDTMW